MSDTPIFIVGIPRSGTTLLSAMLGSHSRMSCGPETNFFRMLSRINPEELCDPKTWPHPAVNFITSIIQTGYQGNPDKRIIDKYGLSIDQIIRYLEQKPPCIPNILSSITEQYMVAMGKSRWIEKTPDHILYMDSIRKYFPDSPILQIIRDPRDVAISLTRTPWGADTYIEALNYWENLIEAGRRFFPGDKLSFTLHYECLVQSPIDELTQLCGFLGEDFESEMLDTSSAGKRLNSMKVEWKERASQPVDTSRVYAWRNELPPAKNKLTEAFIGELIREYDYPLQETFIGYGEIYPSIRACLNYEAEMECIASEGIRFWRLKPDERSISKIYVGDPGSDAWLGDDKPRRLIRAVLITLEIIKARLQNKRILWVSRIEYSMWGGVIAYFLRNLLRPYQYHIRQ